VASTSPAGTGQVGAAVDEAFDGLGIGRDQEIEAGVARGRVVDVGRDGRGAVRRSQHAGHIARPGRIPGLELVRHRPRESRRGPVQLGHQRLHTVIGHGDAGGVERIGLQDVGARLQILPVDPRDDLRLGQHQKVVVAPEILGPVPEALSAVVGLAEPMSLDHGAHGAIQDENSLGEYRLEPGHAGRPALRQRVVVVGGGCRGHGVSQTKARG
jgi:hypothetical protein